MPVFFPHPEKQKDNIFLGHVPKLYCHTSSLGKTLLSRRILRVKMWSRCTYFKEHSCHWHIRCSIVKKCLACWWMDQALSALCFPRSTCQYVRVNNNRARNDLFVDPSQTRSKVFYVNGASNARAHGRVIHIVVILLGNQFIDWKMLKCRETDSITGKPSDTFSKTQVHAVGPLTANNKDAMCAASSALKQKQQIPYQFI